MEPLIYTSKGNVPVSSLRIETQWTDAPDYVKVAVRHFEIESGEMVREDCHVLAKRALLSEAIAQPLT